MITTTGTCNGHFDFMAKVRDFALALPDTDAWTLLAGKATGPLVQGDELILQGPAQNGQRPKFGLLPYTDAGVGYWNVGFVGLTGFNSGANLLGQVNRSTTKTALLSANPMRYRLVGTGRQIKGWIRVGNLYQQFYAGFGLAQSFPEDYPYPMAIGACSPETTMLASSTSHTHRAYWNPGRYTLTVCLPGGIWIDLANRDVNGAVETNNYGVAPWHDWLGLSNERDDLSGGYPPEMSLVMCNSPTQATLMHLEGVHRVSGHAQTAEAIVPFGGKTYEAVPNVFRVGINEFCALEIG